MNQTNFSKKFILKNKEIQKASAAIRGGLSDMAEMREYFSHLGGF
jgi:hypothetical protein